MVQEYIEDFLANIREIFKSVISEINDGRGVESACENLIRKANHRFINKADNSKSNELDLFSYDPPQERMLHTSITDEESGVLSSDIEQNTDSMSRREESYTKSEKRKNSESDRENSSKSSQQLNPKKKKKKPKKNGSRK